MEIVPCRGVFVFRRRKGNMDVVKINTLHDMIDMKKTAANAEELLLDYRHRYALTKRNLFALRSPQLDGMPHGNNPHGLEDRIARVMDKDMAINGLDSATYVKQCDEVLAAMPDEEHRTILKLSYFIPVPITNEMIMNRLNMGSSAYYRHRRIALVEFAELWPPSPLELLAYRPEKGE